MLYRIRINFLPYYLRSKYNTLLRLNVQTKLERKQNRAHSLCFFKLMFKYWKQRLSASDRAARTAYNTMKQALGTQHTAVPGMYTVLYDIPDVFSIGVVYASVLVDEFGLSCVRRKVWGMKPEREWTVNAGGATSTNWRSWTITYIEIRPPW